MAGYALNAVTRQKYADLVDTFLQQNNFAFVPGRLFMHWVLWKMVFIFTQ